MDSQRPSLFKHDLNNLWRMNILMEDQMFIIELFMTCVREVDRDYVMKSVLTLTLNLEN